MTKTNGVLYEGKPFNYVSLFSGIGGFEQALNKLGGNCVLASEIDKFANQSYEALYGHPTAGDITAIAAKDVPNHDVIVGGFPCQAFSVAGKRGGMTYSCDTCDDELTLTFDQYIREEFDCSCGGKLEPVDARGVLFNEVTRIALRKQPKVVLLENVKGLVGHDKGKTLDTIVQTLNDIGYTVDFNVLNSKYFGVPQNRERIFIVAVRDDLITPEPWVIEGTTIVPKGKRRIAEYEGVKTFNFDWPEQGKVTTRLRDVLEAQVDEKYYLSDDKTAALVAQLDGETFGGGEDIEWHGSLKTQEKGIPREYIDVYGVMGTDGVSQCLRTMQGGGREPKIAEPQVIATGADLSYCLDANYTKGIAPSGIDKGRRTHIGEGLPIREATKQGYAIAAVGDAVNFQFPDSTTRRGRVGKQIANTLEASSINQGVVEGVSIDAGMMDGHTKIRKDGTASTITASYAKGLCGQARPFVYEPKYRIRKLTPLECWRLQGFPDEAHATVVAAGISDSQRYKQAGNAVTVNVITAIGERLLTLLHPST